MKPQRIALVHDWLTGRRGGEKVLEVLAEIFPEAPIFTLFHFPSSQVSSLEKRTIYTSFLQRWPALKKHYRWYLPFFPLAIELFNVQEFDLVISSSHCVAKGVIPRPDALHISYIHSPIRYAWNQYFAYFAPQRLGFFARRIIPLIIHYLRLWDVNSASRVDYFIANSQAVAERIFKYYRRTAEVIHPPVDVDFFRPRGMGVAKGNYYLIVSALVPYKRLDLAIEAANRNKFPLKIVGCGPEEKRWRRVAGDNIEFLGAVSDEELLQLYLGARALIVPGEEDFGINILEAQACGVPVIAFGRGGAVETVQPGVTGILFSKLTVESLLAALDNFKDITFNKSTLRKNAEQYSRKVFKERIENYILEKWEQYQDKKQRI
ncbi:glycosyltransferase [Candidatus Aminicenantes bacterium AC-334-K16]|jgi:glycosyltransferase involved in cell wall biosynthesis|nr:glycosyltransferase [Candidatus Aminicenantes bacterium AC-334-K16]